MKHFLTTLLLGSVLLLSAAMFGQTAQAAPQVQSHAPSHARIVYSVKDANDWQTVSTAYGPWFSDHMWANFLYSYAAASVLPYQGPGFGSFTCLKLTCAGPYNVQCGAWYPYNNQETYEYYCNYNVQIGPQYCHDGERIYALYTGGYTVQHVSDCGV